MNQEHETTMKPSKNFEFLRAKAQRLSNLGGIIESNLHDSPADAVSDLRRYSEFLLHEFVESKGRDGVKTRGDHGQHRTIEFSVLIGECSDPKKPWHVPTQQLQWFKDIKNAGDPATHDRTYEARETLRLLNTAWNLSAWVAQELGWERPRDAFAEPQRGGEELAELRSQRDEAARRAAGLPIDLSRWAAKQSITPFRAKKFTGRDWVYRRIEQFFDQDEKRVLVIQGDPGRGKSGVMAQFLDEHLPIETTPCSHFFVDSQGEPRDWICRFYSALLSPDELKLQEPHLANADQTALLREFRHRLSENAITSQKQLVFVIDAVDEAGPSKEAVAEFLRSEFPPNVRVLATVRPTHFDASRCSRIDVFDFEHPDVRNDHRNDGLAFVRAIAPANLSDDALRAIGEIGNGNFLVLSLICQELPSSALEVETYLQQLRNLDQSAPKLYEELFQRAWKRLRRLSHEALRNVYQTLALLAVCRQPLTSEMIKGVLKFETSDWDKLIDNVGEYVREDIILFDGTQTEVFRLFHATFADFVSLKLKSDVRRMELKLATSCRDWIHEAPTEFERAYALRFVIHHFVHAQAWKEVDALLTDLQFIQARFEAGQGHDLLAEYDAVLKAHPQQDEEFKQRIKQDAALHKYVQDIVEYSRRCTEIRNRHERGACDNPVAEIRKLIFPDPPDTTQTIKDMRRTEELQKNPTKSKPLKSTGFTRIRDFQQFIAARLQLLLEVPRAIIDIALNYSITCTVAEAAQKLEPTRTHIPRLIQHNQPIAPELNPLVLRSIDYIKALRELPWVWMNPGATVGFIGNTGYSPNALVDLRTCRSLTSDLITYGTPRAVSMDGLWALLQSDETGPLTLVDLNSQKILGECDHIRPGNFLTTCNLTPDGALVVGIGDAQLVIWNRATSQKRTISLEDFDPEELLLCHTGFVAAVRSKDVETHDEEGAVIREKGLWAFINLIDESVIEEVSDEDFWSFVKKQWFSKPFHSAVRTRWADHTGDGKLALRDEPGNETNSWVSSTRIVAYQNDRELRRFRRSVGKLEAISADGRYGFVKDNDTYAVFDLANGCDTLPVAALNDSKNTNDINCASEIHRFGDEQGQLRTELQLEVEFPRHHTLDENQSIAGKSPEMILRFARTHEWELPRPSRGFTDDFAMTLDASVVVTKVDATSPGQLAEYQKFQARDLNGEAKCDDECEFSRFLYDGACSWWRSFRFEPNAVALTYLASGDHLAVEHCGEWLGLTRDGRTLIFRQYKDVCNDPDRLRFWSIQHQDWLSDVRRRGGNNAIDFFTQSSDGRMALADTGFTTPVEIVSLNRDHSWVLPRPIDDRDEGGPNLFTPDARFLLDHSTNQTYLWSLKSGDCVGIESGSTSFPDSHLKGLPWIDCDGFLRDGSGRKVGIEIRDPDRGPAWVTGARLYRVGIVNGLPVPPTGPTPIPFTGQPIPGTFEKYIGYWCRRCGKRSPLLPSVIDVVDAIHRNAHLDAGSVPVLELPDDAWDDEPGLDFPCSECGQRHRSTPFYVDRRQG